MYKLAKKVPHLNRMQMTASQSFHECLSAEGEPVQHKRGFIREELYRQPDGAIVKAEVFYIQSLLGRFSDDQKLEVNKRHHVWVQHPVFVRINGKSIVISSETNAVMKMLTDPSVPYDTLNANVVLRNEYVPVSFEFDGSTESVKKVASMSLLEFNTHEKELIDSDLLIPSDVFQIVPGQVSLGKGMHSSMACDVDDEDPVTRLFDWNAVSEDFHMKISPEVNSFNGMLIIGAAIKDVREPERAAGVVNGNIYQSSAIVLSNTYDHDGAQILMQLAEDQNGTMKSFVDAVHRDVTYVLASGRILVHNNQDNLACRFKADVTSVPMIVPSAKLQSGALRRIPASAMNIIANRKQEVQQEIPEQPVHEEMDPIEAELAAMIAAQDEMASQEHSDPVMEESMADDSDSSNEDEQITA